MERLLSVPLIARLATLIALARHLEAAEEFLQARGKVFHAFRPAAVGDRRDLGLDLDADHGRRDLLDDGREVGRRDGVDLDRIGKGQMAVGENPGAGHADDAEGEDAGEQRVADAPGSRGRGGDVRHGSCKTPVG